MNDPQVQQPNIINSANITEHLYVQDTVLNIKATGVNKKSPCVIFKS